MIQLIPDKGAYRFSGRTTYAVILNRHAGRRLRYDVLVLAGDHATYIGRELPFDVCAKVIECFEDAIQQVLGSGWIGAQSQVDSVYRFYCANLHKNRSTA